MKKLLSSLLCLAMIATLTGCGSSSDTSTTSDTTTVRVAVGGDFAILDPAIVDDSITANILAQMYDGLYKLDSDGNPVANVATDLPEISDDGLTYTITLKDGYTWSDGEALKASDFVYAWKRAAAMGQGTAYYSQFISNYIANAGDGSELSSMDELSDFGAVADDDANTITITLSSKCAYFTSLLTSTVFYPVRQSAVEANDGNPLKSTWADATDVPTNGAFTATSINSKDEIDLTKNENYLYADEVTLETMSWKVMSDQSSETNAFISGEIDFATSVNVETVNSDEDLSNQVYLIDPFVCNYYVLFNAGDECTNEALQDVEIREAFSLAINREDILTASGYGDYVTELNDFIPFGIPDYDGSDFTTNAGNDYSGGYDLEKAKEIMESKGYSADNMLTLTYSYNDTTMHKNVAQALQASLKEAYIDLQLSVAEKETFFANRDNGEFETCRHAMTADFLDPMAYLSMYYGSSTAGNTVDDATYEALIDEAEALDGEARFEKLHEAEEYLVAEQHYIVPLFSYTDPILKVSSLQGVTSSPEGHYDLTRAYYE
ncbi:MAG: peptide ABC transporter substrate-binding protein [Erysipelotrichaceae bacterium]|nr:peptide ABC transporter substrate-binding protein [Erysipelotrichaceae bacterium]